MLDIQPKISVVMDDFLRFKNKMELNIIIIFVGTNNILFVFFNDNNLEILNQYLSTTSLLLLFTLLTVLNGLKYIAVAIE